MNSYFDDLFSAQLHRPKYSERMNENTVKLLFEKAFHPF